MTVICSKKRIISVHKEDNRFCELEWEVLFVDIAFIEHDGNNMVEIWHVDKEEMRGGGVGGRGAGKGDWGRIINVTSGLSLLRKKLEFRGGGAREFVQALKAVVPSSVLF